MTNPAPSPAVTTLSAQETARSWLKASRERALRLERTVSGSGEEAEILGTLLWMIDRSIDDGMVERLMNELRTWDYSITKPIARAALTAAFGGGVTVPVQGE